MLCIDYFHMGWAATVEWALVFSGVQLFTYILA